MFRSALAGTVSLSLIAVPALAQTESECTNFWINPETGEEDCLQPGATLKLSSPESDSGFKPDTQGMLVDMFEELEAAGNVLGADYVNANQGAVIDDAYAYCERRRRGESFADIVAEDAKRNVDGSADTQIWRAAMRVRHLTRKKAVEYICPDVSI